MAVTSDRCRIPGYGCALAGPAEFGAASVVAWYLPFVLAMAGAFCGRRLVRKA